MIKKIGVLTSGGDAPGMNAAIRGVVRTALSAALKSMVSTTVTMVYMKTASNNLTVQVFLMLSTVVVLS